MDTESIWLKSTKQDRWGFGYMKILCFREHQQESEKMIQNSRVSFAIILHEEYTKDCCESAATKRA